MSFVLGGGPETDEDGKGLATLSSGILSSLLPVQLFHGGCSIAKDVDCGIWTFAGLPTPSYRTAAWLGSECTSFVSVQRLTLIISARRLQLHCFCHSVGHRLSRPPDFVHSDNVDRTRRNVPRRLWSWAAADVGSPAGVGLGIRRWSIARRIWRAAADDPLMRSSSTDSWCTGRGCRQNDRQMSPYRRPCSYTHGDTGYSDDFINSCIECMRCSLLLPMFAGPDSGWNPGNPGLQGPDFQNFLRFS